MIVVNNQCIELGRVLVVMFCNFSLKNWPGLSMVCVAHIIIESGTIPGFIR